MNIWIINQYNMPPEYGHLNRHYNLAKYFSKTDNLSVFVGSYLHKLNKNIKTKKRLSKYSCKDGFNFYFVKTTGYKKSKLLRGISMVVFTINMIRISKKMERPDTVIGSSGHPFAALLSLYFKKKYGSQAIIEIRDLWPESFVVYNVMKKHNIIVKLFYIIENFLYRKADKIIFTMEGGYDYIIDKGWSNKIPNNKVFHLNNGVDLRSFKSNENKYKYEYINNNSKFNVIYVGTLGLVNKVYRIIDIAIRTKHLGIDYYVFGDGEEKEILEKTIKYNKLDNIHIMGRVEKKYIPNILTQSDLNIIFGVNQKLFKYGISTNKLFDYFASKKPVLLTFTTGYSIVDKYNAGIEVNGGKIDDIVSKIKYFSTLNEIKYNKYCENSEKAAKDYDFVVLSENLKNIIYKKI